MNFHPRIFAFCIILYLQDAYCSVSSTSSSGDETSPSNTLVIIIASGVSAFVVLLVLFCLYLLYNKRKRERRRKSFQQKFMFGIPTNQSTSKTSLDPGLRKPTTKFPTVAEKIEGVPGRGSVIGELIGETGTLEISTTPQSSPAMGTAETNSVANTGNTTVVQHGKALSLPGFMMMMPTIDFIIEDKVLSEGGGGIVKTAKLLASHHFKRAAGDRCVIKMIKQVSHEEEVVDETRTVFYQEVSITHLFDSSRYVVKMVGFCPDPMALLTKFYPKGSVADLIRDSEDQLSKWVNIARSICLDAAKAIKEVHASGIVHNDIKPDNLLLDPIDSDPYHVVLCDFGVSMVVDSSLTAVHAMKLSRIRGASLAYASPEMIAMLTSSTIENFIVDIKPADVYAYAITCFEILSRDNSWKTMDDEDIVSNVLLEKRPVFNMEIVHQGNHDSIVSGLIELIHHCWDHNPRARLSMSEVVLRLEFIK